MPPRTERNASHSEIRKGNLYALLSCCTDKELQPLVDLMKDQAGSSLKKNTEFKLEPSRPSRYYMAIADDFLEFGGNSVVNALRKSGPAYQEVVLDVCSRLGVPITGTGIVESESLLLDLYLDREWKHLSANEKERAVASARMAALEEAHPVSIITTNILKPTLLAAAEPAYRITVPGVVQIAYLRRIVLEDISTAQSLVPAMVDSSLLVKNDFKPLLTIKNTNGDDLISIGDLEVLDDTQWPVSNDQAEINKLNPILQAVPSIATAAEVASTRYMEVVINGPLLKAKGVDGYRLITMQDGTFSHGTLLDPSSLTRIVNPAALLQIVSVAVGQKHLADIQRELTEIKSSLKSVSEFQQNERTSKITGIIKYIEQHASVIFSNKPSVQVNIVLEANERELISLIDHFIIDIKAETAAIKTLPDPDRFGSEGMKKAIENKHELLHRHYKGALLAVRARATNLQLSVHTGLSDELRQARLSQIEECLKDLGEDGYLARETTSSMRQKVRTITARTNKAKTLNQRKLELLALNQNLDESLKTMRINIEKCMAQADFNGKVQYEPTRLHIKMEGNLITGLQAV